MSTKPRAQRHAGHAANTETPAHDGQTISAEERSRLIQARAYGLWEQAGRPGGDEARERFWCEAEAEVTACHANGMACHANGKGGAA